MTFQPSTQRHVDSAYGGVRDEPLKRIARQRRSQYTKLAKKYKACKKKKSASHWRCKRLRKRMKKVLVKAQKAEAKVEALQIKKAERKAGRAESKAEREERREEFRAKFKTKKEARDAGREESGFSLSALTSAATDIMGSGAFTGESGFLDYTPDGEGTGEDEDEEPKGIGGVAIIGGIVAVVGVLGLLAYVALKPGKPKRKKKKRKAKKPKALPAPVEAAEEPMSTGPALVPHEDDLAV